MCTVEFAMIPAAAAMKITCGGVEQELDAEGSAYRVLAIVKDQAGKKEIVSDPKQYTVLTSRMLTLKLTQEDGAITDQTLELDLGMGPIELTNTFCI